MAGLSAHYTPKTVGGIPAQLERFAPHMGRIAAQVGRSTYGVVCGRDAADGFEYLCGVEVSDFSGTPAALHRIRIPPQRYAVFSHRAHVSRIRNTLHVIWNTWLPASGRQFAEAPYFERYGEGFDPRTGKDDIEIWVPVISPSGRATVRLIPSPSMVSSRNAPFHGAAID